MDSSLEPGPDDSALRSAAFITECGLIIYKQLKTVSRPQRNGDDHGQLTGEYVDPLWTAG